MKGQSSDPWALVSEWAVLGAHGSGYSLTQLILKEAWDTAGEKGHLGKMQRGRFHKHDRWQMATQTSAHPTKQVSGSLMKS